MMVKSQTPFSLESTRDSLSSVLVQERLQSQVIGGSWLQLARADYDLHEEGQPYRIFEFIFNVDTGQYIWRIWGKSVKHGSVSSLAELPPLVSDSFHRRLPCSGVTSTKLVDDLLVTEFPFRRAMAKDCDLAVRLPEDEEADVSELGKRRCAKCQRISNVKIEDDDDSYLSGLEELLEKAVVQEEELAQSLDKEFTGELNAVITPKKRDRKPRAAVIASPLNDDQVRCRHCDVEGSKSQIFNHEKEEHLRGRFYCDYCAKPMETVHQLLSHTSESHPGVAAVTCTVCDDEVDLKSDFVGHYRSCYKRSKSSPKKKVKKPLTCKICCKSFARRLQLTVHHRWHAGEKSLSCDECDFVTHSQFALFSHKKRHKRDQGDVDSLGFCQHCGKRFTSNFYLRQHIAYAHDKKFDNIKCEHCGLNFMKERQYRRHVNKEHSTDPRFACGVCGVRFGEIRSVKLHEVSHTDEPVVFCDICGKGLKKKRALLDHMRIHTGEKPFNCKECPYECKSSTALSLHRRFKHRGGVKTSEMGPDASQGFVEELPPNPIMKEEKMRQPSCSLVSN